MSNEEGKGMPDKFDAEDPASIKRLLGAVDSSINKLEPFRKEYCDFDKRRVGAHFGGSGFGENRPLNGFELGCNIFQRALNSHEPKAGVTSRFREFVPTATDFKLSLNQEIERIDLGDAFDTCILSALNRIGVMEVGITSSDTPPDGEGYLYDPGHVFADPVLFTDLILDMKAGNWDHMQYIGHEFSAPAEWVRENSSFNKAVRNSIKVGDGQHRPTDSHIGETSKEGAEEFEDTIRIRQLYLTRHQLVLLFAVEQVVNQPLKITHWTGPERGPYHRLSYGKVLGELIPLSPMMAWYDLDDITNTAFNKAADQAERQKTVILVNPSGSDDGKMILDAEDGDMIKSNDPKNVGEARFGGADQVNLGMALWSFTKLKEMGGNWDAIGGQGSMAETATQEQQIARAAGGRLDDMWDITQKFKSGVMRDLGFWMWNDPISEWRIQKPIGAGLSIDAVFAPENRIGSFDDFDVSISAYSGRKRSPSQQGEFLLQRMERFYLQIAPFMQQAGMTLDWEMIIKTMAEYDDTPEVNWWVQHLNGEMMPQSEPKGMAPNTTRTYKRVNESAATSDGQDRALTQMLFGGQPQGGEMKNIAGAA